MKNGTSDKFVFGDGTFWIFFIRTKKKSCFGWHFVRFSAINNRSIIKFMIKTSAIAVFKPLSVIEKKVYVLHEKFGFLALNLQMALKIM